MPGAEPKVPSRDWTQDALAFSNGFELFEGHFKAEANLRLIRQRHRPARRESREGQSAGTQA